MDLVALNPSFDLIDELERVHGVVADSAAARAIVLTKRALLNLENGQPTEAVQDWQAAASSEERARRLSAGGARQLGPESWTHLSMVLAIKAAEHNEKTLLEAIVAHLVGMAATLDRTGADNLAALSTTLLRRGEALAHQSPSEPGLFYLELGIAAGQSLVAEEKIPLDSTRRSSYFNDLGYCVALVAERTDSYERLGSAEAWIRRGLQLSADDPSARRKGELLDSLGYVLTLRASRDGLLETAIEAVESLSLSLQRLQAEGSERTDTVSEHLARATRLRDALAGTPLADHPKGPDIARSW
jgi:hypothetical protein